MNFLSLQMSAGGYEPTLVITDHFTSTLRPSQPETKQPRPQPESCLITYLSLWVPLPQGRNFENKVINGLCSVANVDKTRITPYHPMGNGMPERFNKTLLYISGTLEDDRKSDWKSYVPPFVPTYFMKLLGLATLSYV